VIKVLDKESGIKSQLRKIEAPNANLLVKVQQPQKRESTSDFKKWLNAYKSYRRINDVKL